LLPYIPVVALFGFRPLPSEVLGLVFLIVLAYLLAAELLKRRFYRRSARIPMSGKGG
jgi:hypothetical protein